MPASRAASECHSLTYVHFQSLLVSDVSSNPCVDFGYVDWTILTAQLWVVITHDLCSLCCGVLGCPYPLLLFRVFIFRGTGGGQGINHLLRKRKLHM